MKSCKQCGAAMSSDSPEGLCPRCLLSAAMKPEPAAAEDPMETRQPGAFTGGGPAAEKIDIADPAEVARRLPQFEILELLGRGGMGVVYKARQLQLDRIVALKILAPSDAAAPGFVERFRREAKSLAKLNHPNIVHVHDFGESNGLYYFVMEFVDGANIRALISSQKMTAAEALAIVPKICDALQFAHEEGVVHRDIKPENILIDKKGRVKIADFGLAKLLGREETDPRLTVSGATLGTPRYMAPEQVEKPESVDHRADIYSLGVVFYEMLTGELPMGRFAPPSHKVQIDVRLDEIVLHALERDVALRYQQVSEVRQDVEEITSKPQAAAASSGAKALVPGAEPAPEQIAPPLKPRFRLRYFLLCSVIFTAAFFAALAFWNLRWAGVGLGGAVIFVALCIAVALGRNFPLLLSHWKNDSPIKAVVRFTWTLACCIAGYYLLLGTLVAQFEFRYLVQGSSAAFLSENTGKEYKLVRQLSAYEKSIPQVELSPGALRLVDRHVLLGMGTPDADATDAGFIIGFPLISGFWLLAGGTVMLFAGRDKIFRPKSWRVWIWPSTLVLAMIAGWYVFNVLTHSLGMYMFGGAVSSATLVKAPLSDVQRQLTDWMARHGYVAGDMSIYSMNRVPDGKHIGAAGFENFAKPSPFDRWRWRQGTLVKTTPLIELTYVTTAGNLPSIYVPVDPDAPPAETSVQWQIDCGSFNYPDAYALSDQLRAVAATAQTAAPASRPAVNP
jgi:predicted Ser/Thr protein kinase